MIYKDLIETVSLILENEKINKKGLSLVYELEPKEHKSINEQLFYRSNPTGKFVNSEEFEVELGGILIKFIELKEEKKIED